MKNIWVLSIKTSLPDVCIHIGNYLPCFYAYENFEDAKAALREKLREFAFSDNSMFDGNGYMKYFKEYIDDSNNDIFDDEDSFEKSVLEKLQSALKSVFEGKQTDISNLPKTNDEIKEVTDSLYLSMKNQDGTVDLYGDYEGPLNDYNPKIKTNMFDMSEEKDYFLYLNDMFGQYASSELYIDLKKVEVN